METVFLVCAISGGTVLVLQFLAAMLGFLGDGDVDTDPAHDYALGDDLSDAHGHGVDDHDHVGGTSWFAGLISLRSITTGLTFFGLSGMTALYYQSDALIALSVAGFGGGIALFTVGQIMKGLRRLRADGAARIERTLGSEAIVYLSIPAQNAGPGKITVTVQKRTMEYAAFTQNAAGLPTGSKVRVVAIRGPQTVEVEPLTS